MAKDQPGLYYGHLESAGVSRNNNEKATPYMGLAFKITHISQNGQWIELHNPMTRTVRVWLTEKAIERSFKTLAEMGFNGDFKNIVFDPEITKNGMNLVCSEKDGQYNEWDLEINMGGGGGAVKDDGDSQLRDLLTAQYRSGTGNMKAPAAPPPGTQPQTHQQPSQPQVQQPARPVGPGGSGPLPPWQKQ